jgi:ceramide glucosyltransferase
MPFGVMGLLAGVLGDQALIGAALFAWAVVNRVVLAITAGWSVVSDARALRYCWLYPVRDLMGFCFWAASFIGTTVVWRGERYRLEAEGKMSRVATPAAAASRPVAIDDAA